MKNTLKLFSILAVVLLFAFGANAQTALTQTTLAQAITSGASSGASGIQGFYQTQLKVTSNTGITVAVNGQPVTFLYVDQELFGVISQVTGFTTLYNVLRAQQGTKASPHANGAMVLVQTVTPQFGGFTGSGGFQPADPPLNGACTAANTLVTPWVNVITSAQYLCSSVTGTWVPGFNGYYSGQTQPTAAVASAAGVILPSGPMFHITGALAITGFTVPVGFSKGCFTVINDGAYTWTAAGNIAVASGGAQTVGQTNQFCYDPITAKFYPNHL